MNKPFIIAEVSGNHLGSFDKAKQLIQAAHWAGADAVKFQTFIPEQMAVDYTLDHTIWNGRKLVALYRETWLPREWHQDLFDYARSLGIIPFSSPFSPDDVDFLETLDCPIYKVASAELVDTPLVRRIAKTGKQIIMSTGMANNEEIGIALKEARAQGPRNITLLHCVSSYPADPDKMGLQRMSEMYFRYRVHTGLSDHSTGIGIAIAAAGVGATTIEKHLCLSRELGGPDADFSLEPREFKQMATECRRAYAARGTQPGIQNITLRRSLYFKDDLPAGTVLEERHLKTARPNLGISPQEIDNVVGNPILRAVQKDEPVTWSHFYADSDTKQ